MGLSELTVLRLKLACIRYDLINTVSRLDEIDKGMLAEQQKQMRERRELNTRVDTLGKSNDE